MIQEQDDAKVQQVTGVPKTKIDEHLKIQREIDEYLAAGGTINKPLSFTDVAPLPVRAANTSVVSKKKRDKYREVMHKNIAAKNKLGLETQQRILKAIKRSSAGVSTTELIAALGIAESTLRAQANRMVEAGLAKYVSSKSHRARLLVAL